MLIDCHAHSLPEQALRRFPDADSPRYVTGERRALQRMLDEHDRVGVTHAVVSDSFYGRPTASHPWNRPGRFSRRPAPTNF